MGACACRRRCPARCEKLSEAQNSDASTALPPCLHQEMQMAEKLEAAKFDAEPVFKSVCVGTPSVDDAHILPGAPAAELRPPARWSRWEPLFEDPTFGGCLPALDGVVFRPKASMDFATSDAPANPSPLGLLRCGVEALPERPRFASEASERQGFLSEASSGFTSDAGVPRRKSNRPSLLKQHAEDAGADSPRDGAGRDGEESALPQGFQSSAKSAIKRKARPDDGSDSDSSSAFSNVDSVCDENPPGGVIETQPLLASLPTGSDIDVSVGASTSGIAHVTASATAPTGKLSGCSSHSEPTTAALDASTISGQNEDLADSVQT